jgi:uncharacterized protein YegJ (DUF2314 family)
MGVGLIGKQKWARWVGWLWHALLFVVVMINGNANGWKVTDFVWLLLLAAAAVAYYWQLFRHPPETNDTASDNRPFLSLVLLFREPRFLDAAVLASLASRAWEVEIEASRDDDSDESDASSDDSPERGYVVGEPPLFMVMHPLALCMVHHFDRPYMDDPEACAAQVNEFRIRRAILEHQAWTAVDVMQWFGPEDGASGAYRLIARLLAELADDNVMAIVDPAAGRIFAYDPETEQKLRSENPLAALREEYYSPIISVSSEDADMQAAVSEARRRWPEFVAAFEARSADETAFAIKAPFGEKDRVEFMWVEVTSIENDLIYGKLLNEPADLPGLHEGDRVTVPVADLNDFLCTINDAPVGAFTMKVLAERAKQPPPREDGEGDA